MKKLTFFLMAIFVLNLPSYSQSRYVSLDEVRKIADQNAAALWGNVYSAQPIAYYSANDELIGYRFNYAIGKPFPDDALLKQQCEDAAANGDKKGRWGMDEYGTMFVSARKDIGVIQDYSQSLSPEYAYGFKMETLAGQALGVNVWLKKVYYVNFVNQWFCYTNGSKDVYINVFPKTQVVEREKFLELTQSMPFFCAKGDYSGEWNAYQTGVPMASKAEVWIPNPEMCKYYDWSYGCTPTAATMLLSWWDYNSINTDENYSKLIDIYFQRWDAIQGTGENDYQVPNLQRELAIHMDTDTIITGSTYYYDIDPGIIDVCNLLNYNNYSFDASTYTAHDVEWYFDKIMEEIGTFQRPILNHIEVDGDGHSECCVAYDDALNLLGVHNTWWEGIQWINRNVLIGCTKVVAEGAMGLAVTLEHPLGDTEYNHNGNGELFFANDACEIRWDYDDQVNSYAKISYSVDGGYNWTQITEYTPNDGVFDWHIPFSLNSTDCRLVVSLFTADDIHGGSDASLGNFIITPGGSVGQLQPDIIDYTQTDPDYYNVAHGYTTWCAVGVRSNDDTEWWGIEMFDDDDFDEQLATSYSLNRVEFVVMDGHHSTLSKAIKVNRVIGNHNAIVEFEGEDQALNLGTLNCYWPAFDVVKMYDVHLTPGEYRFILTMDFAGPNLDFALFGSNGVAYYAGRPDLLASSTNPENEDDIFSFEIITEDDYGLCVWANDNLAGNYSIEITDRLIWTGTVSSDWFEPLNWDLNYIPDLYTDVIIPAGTPFPPVILHPWALPAHVRNLQLNAGVQLNCEYHLSIYGNFDSEGQLIMNNEGSFLSFKGGENTYWSDPGSDDVLSHVSIAKENASLQVDLMNNISISGSFDVSQGIFQIDNPLTLQIGSSEPYAFSIKNGGTLSFSNDPLIEVAGEIVFWNGSNVSLTACTIECGGDFKVINNDDFYLDFAGVTLVMNGINDQSIIDQDDGILEFGNITINKTGSCFIGNDHLTVNGDLRIEEGTFDLNAYNALCSGDVDIFNGGVLSVDEYSDLGVGQNHSLTVRDGGLLEVAGTNDHNAKITVQPEGTGYYTFEVLNGGTISARHGIFERMDAFGLNIYSGALIDPANSFNYCTFRDGASGNAALLVVQNEQDFTVEEAYFPNNTWGGQYNVWKSNNAGNVIFAGATGSFSGTDYENDPNNLVDWRQIFWKVELDLMLEGPFNGSGMDANINNRLPEYQPYEPILPYFGNPMPEWYHSGEEFVISIPNADIVDWVIVELRDAPTVQQALPGTAIEKRAALINKSGQVVALDGFSPLSITSTFSNNLYAAVLHRNHLGIISAYPLTQTKGTLTYDFTTGPNKSYGGTEAVKELAPGIWGMIGGDSDGNGIVNDNDKTNAWDTEAGSASYSGCDLNMDFQIDNLDKNDIWISNQDFHSFIPDVFGCGEPLVDARDGQVYPTVQIGTQCWMVANLNIGQRIDGNQQQINNGNIEKFCYADIETNCATYGGLYQWNEMMQYVTQEGIQGVCPDEWHVPTIIEWDLLSSFLGGDEVSGGKLKEAGNAHWNPPNIATNESGFTALPGGYCIGYYAELGNNGYFWTSTEYSTLYATYRRMVNTNEYLYLLSNYKEFGLSVRCLKDANLPPDVPSDPSPPDGSINQPINTTLSWTCSDPENDPLTYDVYFGPGTPPELVSTGQSQANYNPGMLDENTTYYWKIVALDGQGNSSDSLVWSFTTETLWDCGDPVTDTRDMKTYSTVQIGTQCWMADNLNFGEMIDGSQPQTDNLLFEKYCYNNVETNCSDYGGLYQWNEMMKYVTQPGTPGICMAGWHIPTNEEWTTLINFLEGEGVAGGKMKETGTTHWIAPNDGATNESGFTALPGGSHNGFGIYQFLGQNACFWTSTQYLTYTAWYLSLSYNNGAVYRYNNDKVFGYSIRCLKD
jgi:uncharacterized protein (TIGR02145 family)